MRILWTQRNESFHGNQRRPPIDAGGLQELFGELGQEELILRIARHQLGEVLIVCVSQAIGQHRGRFRIDCCDLICHDRGRVVLTRCSGLTLHTPRVSPDPLGVGNLVHRADDTDHRQYRQQVLANLHEDLLNGPGRSPLTLAPTPGQTHGRREKSCRGIISSSSLSPSYRTAWQCARRSRMVSHV